jgi:hypothetical protein
VAIRITAVHLSGGDDHEHIVELEWVSLEHKNEGCSTLQAIIEWLDAGGDNTALVGRGTKSASVAVMREGERAWLQAAVNGAPNNRLLEVPRY